MKEQKLKYYLNNKNFSKQKGKKKSGQLEGKLSVIGDKIVLNSRVVHYEEPEAVTSFTYLRKNQANTNKRWSKEDDKLFYDALACYGCEFSMMSALFPGRSRHTLKLKYKREYKQHPEKVEKALANFGQFDEKRFEELNHRAKHLNGTKEFD